MLASLNKTRCVQGILFVLTGFLAITPRCEAAADREPVLTVRIGVTRYRDSGEFYQGEPILMHMYIARREADDAVAQKPILIGSQGLAWYDNVTFHVCRVENTLAQDVGSAYQGDKAVSDEIVGRADAGDGSAPRKSTGINMLVKDAKVELWGAQPKKAELGTNDIARSFWAIDSAITANWPTGKYIIEVVFDTTDKRKSHPNIYHGKLQGNQVAIAVNEPNDDTAKADVHVAGVKYLMGLERYDEAIKECSEVLRLNPEKKEVHCQLGRAHQLKGDLSTAIKEYQAYVDWVRTMNRPSDGEDDVNDHADVIENIIKTLQTRLQKK